MENSLIQNTNSFIHLPKNWKVLSFVNVIDDVSGGNLKTQKSEFLEKGLIPVIDQGKDLIAGYVDNEKATVKTNTPHIVFGDHTRNLKYIDFPFAMGADGTKVLKVKSNIEAIEKYIYYFFQTLNIPETGYNRHFKYLKECLIPLPSLQTQQKIAAILDKADELRQYNKQLIEKYDDLTQSLFLEMFGDPVRNEKGWEKLELKKFGNIITGNTPPRNDEENYSSNFIEWLKTDNINDKYVNVTQAKEYLSEKGFSKARFVENDALLVACIAGSIESIGRASLTERKVSFNQQINAIQPFDDVNPKYLYNLFKISKKYIQNHASNGMKRMLTKGEFEKILMIKPTLEIQNKFAERVQLIETQKQQAQEATEKSELLFQGLLQQAFNGELN